MEEFIRFEMLVGKNAIEKLKNSHVAVFGIGGVGGNCAQSLARSAVGTISLIDADTVSISNMNRQAVAFHSTLNALKVDVMKDMILDINKSATVHTYPIFFEEEIQIDFSKFDYIIDAVDSVKSKLLLIKIAKEKNIPIISSMGAGNKLDPSAFMVSDIKKTEVCPLARVMRKKLKDMGITSLKVVYSKEIPTKSSGEAFKTDGNKAPGSSPFVPPVAGLILASEVVKDLIEV